MIKKQMLKPYKGFDIEKSWYQRKEYRINVIYTAYPAGSHGVFDADSTLKGLKEKIDRHLK